MPTLTTETGSEKAHAKFSASGASRWLACPGSISLTEKMPEKPQSSRFAEEGTKAHTVLEMLIKNRNSVGKTVSFLRDQKFPESMIIHGQMALKHILKRVPKGAELHAEIRADLPVSLPNQFGTTDVVIAEPFGLLEIIDYKYGAGIPVSATDEKWGANPQLVYYALGVAHKYDYNFERVRLTIMQPRAQIDGEFIRSHDLTIDELLGWKRTFEIGIKDALKPNPKLFPGTGEHNHCRFCPAAAICPEIGAKAIAQAKLDFDDGELTSAPPVQAITPSELTKMLAAFEKIESYIKAVREYAFDTLKRGHKVEGWKLVHKRSVRKWTDIKAAEMAANNFFGLAAYSEPELLSPAQMEKLGPKGKEFAKDYSSNVSSGLTMVPSSDKRPDADPFADDEFDALTE